MTIDLDEIPVERFVRKFKYRLSSDKHKFAFFLGAGCSVSSGIPSSKDLVSRWMKALYEEETGKNAGSDEADYKKWTKERYPDYNEKNGALFYGRVIKDLFPHKAERKAEFERLIQNRDPAFGYGVLAQLVGNSDLGEYCNIILTTNFDDLVADALYIYSRKKPLVIAHESLTGFIRLTSKTPVVIKLHGDVILEIENTEEETTEIAERLKKKLDDILKETGIIFIGYGGNDEGVLKILTGLSKEHLKNGVYWINNELPENEEFSEWLSKTGAIWVKVDSFDKLMLYIFKEFNLKTPDENRFKVLLQTYFETFKRLEDELKTAKERKIFKDAIKDTWLKFATEALSYEKTDPQKANEIYVLGLKRFPHSSGLVGNYALFFYQIRKDYDSAEVYFKKALELDPNHANNTGNYALFLKNIQKDYDSAEVYFKKALELDPNHANNTRNYASFLYHIQKDYNSAEVYFKKSLELDPNNAINTGNYASFLYHIQKDYNSAEVYFKKALELDPNHATNTGNYASFLYQIRKDYDLAEVYYRKALELDPNNATNTGNYASFLKNIRKDYDSAEVYFKKALELDPNDANNTGNYALFLKNIRKDYDSAEVYFKKSLELDPNDALHTGNYASFLYQIRKDYDSAEVYFKKSLELDPNNALHTGNYASFLYQIRKDYDSAEVYFKKALELDPNDALYTGNYALLLKNIQKDYDSAEVYFKKALELDPNDALHTGNYASFLYQIRKDYDLAEVYYRKALELDPNNATNTGNFASFLKNIRKDYDSTEVYFKKSLELDPNNATNTGNFASFLKNIRKDYDSAEVYFKKALELDPNHANNTANFASFLYQIRKDYDSAEVYFKKALELDPNHADNIGNYAGFLLNKGNKKIGKEQLDKALELSSKNKDLKSLYLECLFYRYAHFFDNKKLMKKDLQEIRSLLNDGIRSIGWDFSENIKRAKLDGHPNPELLDSLSKQISEET